MEVKDIPCMAHMILKEEQIKFVKILEGILGIVGF